MVALLPYKVGDNVTYTGDEFKELRGPRVITARAYSPTIGRWFYSLGGGGGRWIDERDIISKAYRNFEELDRDEPKCECGALHVRGIHSRWCPASE